MDDVIFSEDSQIFKIQYLWNYAINMHRVNAKKFQIFFPNDLLYKINSDSDFIAPLKDWIFKSDDPYRTLCKYCKVTFNQPKNSVFCLFM